MKEFNIKDRVPTYPNRVILNPVPGETNTFDMERADVPREPGTPINKAMLDSIIKSRLTGRFYPCEVTFDAMSTTTITRNPIPTTGWAVSNIRNATNGTDYTIEASSSINTDYSVEKALDADIETQWASTDGLTHYYIIRFPVALKIKKFKLLMGITGNTTGNTLVIQGSNNNTDWENLHTITSYPLNDIAEYTISTQGIYEYYRLYFTRSASGRVYINTFEITDCEVSVYSAHYANNEMPTVWDKGQRVTIETTEAPKHSVLVNTFNDLIVNTILQPLKRYEFVYNGESFDVKEV